ncbi:hypothetical protein D5274_04010 [bacterium 1XD42-94]|nr:hypothetical protein [bacterium 1XD42-76]NBK04343.1 hypothetical protein [bacterium 1XD42-94]
MDYFSHKFTEYNNKCYFMAKKFNGIYMLDLENGKTSFFGMVPGEPSMGKDLFKEIVCIDHKLFIIPDKASSIHVLDENANEIVRLELENRVSRYFRSDLKFLSAFFCNGIIYLVPYSYPALVTIDPYTYEITYYDDFVNESEKADNNLHAGMFMIGKRIGNEICLVHRSSNKLFFFDMELKKCLLVSIGNTANIYVDICFDGTFYWLVTAKGEVLKWNREKDEVNCIFNYKTYGVPQTIITSWNVIEKQIFYHNGYIWIFSYCYPPIRINTKNKTCELMEEFELGKYGISYHEAGGYNHVCIRTDDNRLYVYCHYQNLLYQYELLSGDIRAINLIRENDMHKDEFCVFLQEVSEDNLMIDKKDKKELNPIGKSIFRKLNR